MWVFGGTSAGALLFVACLGVGLLAAGGAVGADEPPVADAGLDQTIERNATVYLDAGGSYDHSGEVAGYRWSVLAPNGTTFEPECADCERTHFRATQTGQYNVTVTVTDDAEASTNDIIHVTVEEPEPPELRLTGPESLFVERDGTTSADVRAGADPVSRLVWSVDGSEVGTEELSEAEIREQSVSFTEAGTHTVTAAVTDVLGRTTTDTHAIEVVGTPSPAGPTAPSTAASGGNSPDASTDFVATNSDTIRDYSDLSFNNYADGDSAITLANTAGPGDITLVDGETARKYLEPYNWHSVNLGDLVENNLIDTDTARDILNRAQQNQEEKDNGAVGGINPYEPTNTQEATSPVNSPPTAIGPSPLELETTTGTGGTSDAAGPRLSETVTLTQGFTDTESESGTATEKTDSTISSGSTSPESDTTSTESGSPALSDVVTVTSGSDSTGLDIDVSDGKGSSNKDSDSTDENSNSNGGDERDFEDDSTDSGTGSGGSIGRGNGSGTITVF